MAVIGSVVAGFEPEEQGLWVLPFTAEDSDLGGFVFDALGARWAMDLGADNYNLPGYFGGQRWQLLIPLAGRRPQHPRPQSRPGTGPGPSAAARLIRFESKPAKAFAIADLTSAYHRSARKVCRGLALLARNQLVIQDEIQAAQPAEVWWFMHTPAGIAIEKDGRAATLEQAGVQLRAEILSPERAFFEVRDAQAAARLAPSGPPAGNREIRKLTIHLARVTDCRLAVRLVPLPRNEGLVPSRPGPRLCQIGELKYGGVGGEGFVQARREHQGISP